MVIGCIGALDSEIALFKSELTDISIKNHCGFSFLIGKLNNHKVIVTKSGIGKVNMALTVSTLISLFKVDLLINTGIAGSINTEIGRVVVGTSFRYYDFIFPNESRVNEFPPAIKSSTELISKVKSILNDDVLYGTILTGDRFITSTNELNGAPTRGVKAIDMESTAFAQSAKRFKKKFLVFRCISDRLSYDDYESNNKFSAISAAEMVIRFIKGL